MTSWFRSWHGAPTDPKWILIAKKADVTPGCVTSLVWALLDHASQCNDRGCVASFDIETFAAFSGFEEDGLRRIMAALNEKGIIKDGRLTSWEKRQPKREDSSSERVLRYRQKHRQRDAVKRTVTQCNSPDTDTDTEQNISASDRFDDFWEVVPRKVAKGAAEKAWRSALKHASPEEIVSGMRKYAAGLNGTEPRFIKHPATWLNGKCWLDDTGGRTPAEIDPILALKAKWFNFEKFNQPIADYDINLMLKHDIITEEQAERAR